MIQQKNVNRKCNFRYIKIPRAISENSVNSKYAMKMRNWKMRMWKKFVSVSNEPGGHA